MEERRVGASCAARDKPATPPPQPKPSPNARRLERTTYGENKDGSAFPHAVIYNGGHFQDLNSLILAGSLSDPRFPSEDGRLGGDRGAPPGAAGAWLVLQFALYFSAAGDG